MIIVSDNQIREVLNVCTFIRILCLSFDGDGSDDSLASIGIVSNMSRKRRKCPNA